MGTLEEKRNSLKLVVEAAKIHGENLTSSLINEDRYSNPSFKSARRGYINRLESALTEVTQIKLDDSLKVSERVRDLNLEQAVDLLHAVEDHIRALRSNKRSEFE